MLEAAFDVERATVRARQLPGGGEVGDDPGERDQQHDQALGALGRDQPADGAVDDQDPEHQKRGAVGLSREDLGPAQAEGEVAARRAPHQPDHDQRQSQRGRVGERVRGVREERQRVGEDAGDDLAAMNARISVSATASCRAPESASACAWR